METKKEKLHKILTRLDRIVSKSGGFLTICGKTIAHAVGCSPAFVSRTWKNWRK